MSSGSVHLVDGTKLPSAAGLVTAAKWSWTPNIDIRPASLHAEFGIPSSNYTKDQKEYWRKLDNDADKVILEKFPMLKNSPGKPERVVKSGDTLINPDGILPEHVPAEEQFRLYRFIAPANGDRSIAFQGYVANLINHVRNEVAALWIYAYLNDKLDIDPKTIHQETARETRYWALRYPMGFGNRFPDFVFEQIPYFDQLLQDLGISCRRKATWFKEIFEPYAQAEYRGVVGEWLSKDKRE